jgi:hypothetical protein
MEKTLVIAAVAVVLFLLIVRRIGCIGLLALAVVVGGLLWWQWPHLLALVPMGSPWPWLLRWLSSHLRVVWSW